MRYKRQAGIATNVSYSKVILGQQDELSGFFGSLCSLISLLQTGKHLITIHSDTPGDPTRLEVFSICICRTKNLGVVKNTGGNKYVFNTKFCFFSYACENESKKNITKITRMFLKI